MRAAKCHMGGNPNFYRRRQNLEEEEMLNVVRGVVGFRLSRLAPIQNQGMDVHNQVDVSPSAAFDIVLNNTSFT
jgi:hypothetical protein